MCNKVAHKTTWGAVQEILALKNRGKVKKNRKMGGYWCDNCQAYHITSDFKRNKCVFKTK